MADNPEVPDLKKALENKPAGFAWTPAGTAKSAASAVGASAPPRTQNRDRIALISAALVTGGLVFSYAAFRFAGTDGGSGGGANLSGVASSMKIRFARQKDPTDRIIRDKTAASEKMRFDLIKGAPGTAPETAAAGANGAPGENGDAPMNYEEGSSKAGGAGSVASGNIPGQGKGGKQDGAGGLASGGGGGMKTGSLVGSVKFRGMQRVSATAGFRGIGARGAMNKTIHTTGSAARSGAASRADGAAGGSNLDGSDGNAASGAGAGAGRGSNDSASGGGGGGNGGGGGGGNVDTSGVDATKDNPAKIADLMAQAKDLSDKAEDDKKKAIALKALGQDPQAAYHYDRYQKEKKASEQKQNEATRLTADMNAAASAATTVQPAH